MSKRGVKRRYGMPKVATLISFYSGDKVLHDGELHDGGEAWMEDNGVENYLFLSSRGATCMACGSQYGIQRCHILPLCEGGDNSLKNIHLLCKGCHSESEFRSGESYWKWMRYVNTHRYKSWMVRLMEMFELDTGMPPTSENLKKYWSHKLSAQKQEAFI